MRAKGEKPINFDKWSNKTKKKRRIPANSTLLLKRDIDAGFKYFMSQKPTRRLHLGYWSL